MAISESNHWYQKDGTPSYTIVGANGKERAPTLRDARKLNLYPSVTTVMGMAAKPGLENWKINQALMAALTLPRSDDESLDDFMARAKQDAKEQAIAAAERGTAIHADIERGFYEGVESVAYEAVKCALDKMMPGHEWVAEDSFCHSELGYAGKVDLYSPAGIVVDFKTKDGLSPDADGSRLVYDEHGMQLSAYAEGLGFPDPERVSVFVDRSDPSIVVTHRHDKSEHSRHFAMFCALLNYWQASKKYIPGDAND